MRIFRRLLLVCLLLLIGVAVWGAIYGQKKGFTRTWRELVEAEFASRGVYVDIGRLTLGPFQGLVAEDVNFYVDPQRRKRLATVGNVILDLDLSDVLDRDLSINSLDAQDDRMTLSLDPGDSESEELELKRFTGRLVVTDNQIEIVRANAQVAGIDVSMKGSLFRIPDTGDEAAEVAPEDVEAQQRLNLLEVRRRLNRMKQVLEEVEKFTFSAEEVPRLEVEFSGDLEDLSGLYADIRFSANEVRRANYLMESLAFSGEYQGDRERGVLKELHLKDRDGDLRVRGDWSVPDRVVQFELESSSNLPAMVSAIWPNPKWGEVVFYSPPKIRAEGTLRLWQISQAEWPLLPLELIGELKSERIGSRGEVFDGLEMDFAMSGDRYYVRNLRLDHETGVILANLIYDPRHPDEVFRFQSEMRLDPGVMLPFIPSDLTRAFIADWDFDDNSAVYFAVIGGGDSLTPEDWKTRGVIDLRSFRRLNVAFEQLEAEYESTGQVHSYRNLKVVRPEGDLTAALLQHDAEALTWEVNDLRSTMDLYASVQAVAPSLAKSLEAFQFAQPPVVTLNGLIDSGKEPEEEGAEEKESRTGGRTARHDFELGFKSEKTATFEFLGRPLPLEHPEGVVRASEGRLRLSEFSAGLMGGDFSATFETDQVESDRSFEATLALDGVSGDGLLRLYGNSGQETGGTWNGEMTLSGKLGAPDATIGEGSAVMEGGNLWGLPIFAGVEDLLEDLEEVRLSREAEEAATVFGPSLPESADPGKEEPSEAQMELGLKDGILSVQELKADSGPWSLEGGGTLNFNADKFQFRLKGAMDGDKPMSLKGRGSMNEPIWETLGKPGPPR